MNSRVYVLSQNNWGYNDETYYPQEGSFPITVYRLESEAKYAAIYKTIHMLSRIAYFNEYELDPIDFDIPIIARANNKTILEVEEGYHYYFDKLSDSHQHKIAIKNYHLFYTVQEIEIVGGKYDLGFDDTLVQSKEENN